MSRFSIISNLLTLSILFFLCQHAVQFRNYAKKKTLSTKKSIRHHSRWGHSDRGSTKGLEEANGRYRGGLLVLTNKRGIQSFLEKLNAFSLSRSSAYPFLFVPSGL